MECWSLGDVFHLGPGSSSQPLERSVPAGLQTQPKPALQRILNEALSHGVSNGQWSALGVELQMRTLSQFQ